MKKVALALSIIFTLLTFFGAGYVLYHGGKANTWYSPSYRFHFLHERYAVILLELEETYDQSK